MPQRKQETISEPSLIGSMVNPITQMELQYASMWAIPMWASAAKTGSLTVAPYMWHGQIINPALSAFGVKENIVTKALFNTFEFTGTDQLAKSLLPDITSKITRDVSGKEFLTSTQSVLRKWVAKNKGFQSISAQSLDDVFNLLPKDPTLVGPWANTMNKGHVLAQLRHGGLATATKIAAIGSIMTGVSIGIMAGQTISFLSSMVYKGIVAANQFATSKYRHMKALEFGESLGRGFMSKVGATERQRAIQELQRTPIQGGRAFGNEAANYARII